MARRGTARHSRHFLWMSLVRLERETISWRANILARWVSSRHGAQRGCPQVLQKYMVSSSCVGRGAAGGGHGPRGVPFPPAPLPSPPWRSAGRSWRTARPPRCRPSCPPGTGGAGPRGAAPCPPSPLRGACGDGGAVGWGHGQGRGGDGNKTEIGIRAGMGWG